MNKAQKIIQEVLNYQFKNSFEDFDPDVFKKHLEKKVKTIILDVVVNVENSTISVQFIDENTINNIECSFVFENESAPINISTPVDLFKNIFNDVSDKIKPKNNDDFDDAFIQYREKKTHENMMSKLIDKVRGEEEGGNIVPPKILNNKELMVEALYEMEFKTIKKKTVEFMLSFVKDDKTINMLLDLYENAI